MTFSTSLKFFAASCLTVLGIITSDVSADTQTHSYPQVKVFIDVDYALVNKLGGTAKSASFVDALIAKVDAIYRSQLGISVVVAGSHFWTRPDPFNHGQGQSETLASFAAYSENTYRVDNHYDVGHLLSGNIAGGEGGIAYQGSACGDEYSSRQAYGISQPDLTDEYEFSAHLFSHELGHNLNSDHDAFPACSVKTIMCVGQIGGNFSDASKLAIGQYIADRRNAGCFPEVIKNDPAVALTIKSSITGSKVNYTISGGEGCTSLNIVASPTLQGLSTVFGYLPLGGIQPAAHIFATSPKAAMLTNHSSKRLFAGVYCDGQLAKATTVIQVNKIKSKLATSSIIRLLRSLKTGFKTNKSS